MQGKEISDKISSIPALKLFFRGVFSINTMPKGLKKRHFLIANTDLSTSPGSHWICVLKNDQNEIELFDSLGIDSIKLQWFISHCKFATKKALRYNISQVQSFNSDTCGKFVIYFIVNRLLNVDKSYKFIVNDIFDENCIVNETLVCDFYKDL